MILVTASTGHLGQLVLDELRTRVDPSSIVAAARRPDALAELAAQGISVRELDYDRPDTVKRAMDGVSQVLLISGTDFGRRVQQHAAVVDAAVAAGVEHIAYTSVLRADTNSAPVAPEHVATEKLLAATPPATVTTLLRHGWYIENYTEQLGPALANGAFIGSAGEGRIAAASRGDYAAADVAVLLDRSRWGATYELAGSGFSMAELAAAVSSRAGRHLPYLNMTPDEYRSALLGAGLPDPMVEFLVAVDLAIADGQLDGSPAVLADLIHRQPASLVDTLQALSWPPAGAGVN